MRTFRAFWWGELSLRQSFWGFYVAGWFVASIVSILIGGVLVFVGVRPLGFLLVAGTKCLYPVWAAMGVWRSADLYPYTRWWPNMAKAFVIVSLCFDAFFLIHGGAQRIMELATSS